MADTINNPAAVQETTTPAAPGALGVSSTRLTPTNSLTPATPTQGLGISSEAAKRILGAASGGPLTGAAAPIKSGIREATVQQAAQAQTAEAQEKAKLAEAKQKQQEAEIANQLSEEALRIKEQALSTKQQFAAKANSLIQDLRQNMGRIDVQREEAKMKQLGFLLRLNNEKYVSRLQSEGARKRLTNMESFKDEVINTVFQNQLELADSDLRFKQLLRADERNFQRQAAEMDIDMAWDIMTSMLNDSMIQSRYAAIGQAGKAVIQAGYTYSKETPKQGGGFTSSPDTLVKVQESDLPEEGN